VSARRPLPFVGRAEELGVLVDAASGSTPEVTAWLVGGDAGVGKTRLLEEVIARVDPSSATIARGNCRFTAQGALPFVAVAEVLHGLAVRSDQRMVADTIVTHPDLAILLPDLLPERAGELAANRSVGVPAGGHDAGEDGSRLRLFDGIATLLERFAEAGPVCVVLEDLHWAEPSTRDLLGYLVLRLVDQRVTIIGSYRSDDVSRSHPLRAMLAELDRNPHVRHMTLRPFDADELAVFATDHLDEPPTGRMLDQLALRSGGNAFYAAELLDAINAGRGGVRNELFDLILARVESLSDSAQDTMHLLAAAGGPVRDELLAAVTQKDEDDLDATLREAIERQVVVARDDGLLSFRHALMQEAVYSTLLSRQRRRKHERYANVLLERPELAASVESEPAELAWHLREARRFDEAFRASLRAADVAESILAFSEAVEHLDQALELWDGVDAAERPCSYADLLVRAARLAHRAGNSPRAVHYQRAALEQPDDLGPTERALLHNALGTYLNSSGQALRALEEMRTAEALIADAPESVERAAVLAGLGRQLMLTMWRETPTAVLSEAIEIARAVGATDILCDALNSLGTAWLHDGQYERGVRLLTEALDLADRDADVFGAVRTYTNLASGLTLVGDLAEAERVARQGLAMLAGSRQPAVHAFYIRSNLCETLSEEGRWDERDAVVRQTRRPEGILPITWSLHHSLTSALRRGHFEEAQEIVDGVEVDELSAADPQGLFAFWSGVAQLAAALHDEPRAERAIAAALDASGCLPHHLMMRSLRIELTSRRAAAGDAGAAEEAAGELDLMESLVAEWLEQPDPRAHRLLALLHQSRAEVAVCRGDDSTELWNAAIAEWDAGGFRWHRAAALLRLGSCLLRAGRRSAAAEALRASAESADEIGAVPVSTDARRLLSHAGLLPAGADGSAESMAGGGVRLTERELAVLGLLAEGKTNRQIGEQLFISAKTASVHVSRILGKLGVENRTEAAAAGRRAGLVP